MRHFVDRYRYAAVVAAIPLLLTACGKLTPQGGNETMTLLHEGSEKVCIAPDVQSTLRNLIVAKPSEMPDTNVPLDIRIKAAAAVTLSYDMTTLESVDPAVSKATCNTTLKIGSANGSKQNTFRVDYAISPSAENPNAFVVTGNVGEAHAFATDLIDDEIRDAAAKIYAENEARETAQKQQQLLAIVNERWLNGAWIDAGADAASCGNGNAIWFEAGHVLEGGWGKGRWALAADQLHIVGGDTTRFNNTGAIDIADPISFHVSWTDGTSYALRRCTKAETEVLPQATDPAVTQ